MLTLESMLLIVIGALNRLDFRLTGHCERVTYLMQRLLKDDKRYDSIELCRLLWIVLFHDIGNFEKKSIQSLIEREKDTAFSHARFGYFFLRAFSPFQKYVPIVFFHHSDARSIDSSDLSDEVKWAAHCLQAVDCLDLFHVEHPAASREEAERFLKSPVFMSRLKKEAIEAVCDNLLGDEWKLLNEQSHIRWTIFRFLQQFNVTEYQESLFTVLVRSIDFRSRVTALHCAAVVRISDMLASLFNLNKKNSSDIHLGAMLHDLGKIATPTYILESTERLEGEEWNIMKSHVIATEKLLRGHVSDDVVNIAIRHHETLDGAGYPYGIKGNELTLSQRIVTVADIVSALAAPRSYKEGFPIEKVCSILDDLAKRGKICGDVLNTFIRNKYELYEAVIETSVFIDTQYNIIREEYSDKSILL